MISLPLGVAKASTACTNLQPDTLIQPRLKRLQRVNL